MTSLRKRKKHSPNIRHWHWDGDGPDKVCYLTHAGGWRLHESRERRVEAAGRRRMRRDIRKQKVVTGTRYGKSRLPITLSFVIDPTPFVKVLNRMAEQLRELDWAVVRETWRKNYEASKAVGKQDCQPAQRYLQAPVEQAASDGGLEEAGDSEGSGEAVGS